MHVAKIKALICVDQLCIYCAANLRLCFCNMQNVGFLMRRLITFITKLTFIFFVNSIWNMY